MDITSTSHPYNLTSTISATGRQLSKLLGGLHRMDSLDKWLKPNLIGPGPGLVISMYNLHVSPSNRVLPQNVQYVIKSMFK